MTGELVLITGGTGHLGYRTLVEALSKGYQVRAAVRSETKIVELKAAKSSQSYLNQLSFVIVPDIEKDGAFDEASKGVDYIIHLASPLAKPSDDDEANIIRPAIRGTLSILHSALKQPSIKRIVITSSVAAVRPTEPRAFTEENIEEDPHGPYPNTFAAYGASKKLAYNRTRDFIAKEKPKFTVINIMPTFVIGKNELAKTPESVRAGSNSIVLAPLVGETNPAGMRGMACHVDDVAYVHVASLDPKIKGNQNFGVNSTPHGIQWDDAIEIVKKHFPKEVEKGVFPVVRSQRGSTLALRSAAVFDASSTEELFGIKFKNFEEQVVSLAGHYAAVSAKS